MKKISAKTFQASCLSILDELQQTGESVLITKRGKPVAKLVPASLQANKKVDDIFGLMAGKARIVGDITSPIWPSE